MEININTTSEEKGSATLVGNATQIQYNSELTITKPGNPVKNYIDRDAVKNKLQVECADGALDVIAKTLEKVISRDDKVFYDPAMGLISLGSDGKKHPIDRTKLQFIAMRHADFVVFGGDEFKKINCPLAVCDALLSFDEWPLIKPLMGITKSSLLLPDGRFIDKPGYDEETGIYALQHGCYPHIASPVSKHEAMNALYHLFDLLRDFPFNSPEDASAAMSMLISALLRPVMQTCPLTLINASNKGSGKTTLAQVFSIIAQEKSSGVTAWSGKSEELEKRLFGLAKSGSPFLLFDNLMNDIDDKDGVLSAYVTGGEMTSRTLGSSEVVTAKANAFMVATGNNINAQADMARRTITIRLTPNVDNPENRHFERDILAFTQYNRDLIVKYILTVVKGWFDNGCYIPDDLPKAGSFPDWERLARFPLLWLDQPDPWAVVSRSKEIDPDIIAFDAFLKTAIESFGVYKSFSVDCIVSNAKTAAVVPDQFKQLGTVNSRQVGKWLISKIDAINAGYKLIRSPIKTGGKTWYQVAPIQ